MSAVGRSEFLKRLDAELLKVLAPEMELTIKVALLTATGHSRAEVCRRLDAPDLEIRMALERLKKIAREWT